MESELLGGSSALASSYFSLTWAVVQRRQMGGSHPVLPVPYERWGDSQERIDAGAEEAGRNPRNPSHHQHTLRVTGGVEGS